MFKCTLLSVLMVFDLCSGYKFLVFFPYPGKSHTILGEGYVKLLLAAGHDVTYVTPIILKNQHPKLRQIDVSSNLEGFFFDSALDLKKLLRNEVDFTDMAVMYSVMHDIAHNSIMHENVQKLFLDTNEEFDAVVVEWLYSDFYAGVSTVFNCPYIWSSSMEPHPMILRLIDEMPNTAYIPDHILPIEPPLTFWQRVKGLWMILELQYTRWWLLADKEEQSYRDGYGPAAAKRGRKLPPYEEVKYNTSLVLGNSHVSSGLAIRLPQNYVSIAGYHIDNKVQPLPEDLQKIMDSAQHGVIYFSMGSMMKSKTMPDEMKKDLLRVFSGLKQTVIWKLEETLPELPKNVHIIQWAPQQSILAHSNCVLFITHGGLLSTSEALHFGVPIIGIPLFADQFINIKRAVSKGFALEVNINYDTPTNLKAAIEEVLGKPTYRERVKELSLMYHDRVVPPGVELVHWVEHVARTRGAAHLRSPALNVPWYQKMYLDLIACIVSLLFIIYKIIKHAFCILFAVKKNNSKQKYS